MLKGFRASEATITAHQMWDLRLCNAYAHEGWAHVYHSFGRRAGIDYTTSRGDGETMLTKVSGPLPFKRCTDVAGVALKVGSLLKFRMAGDMHVGTFSVDKLPAQGSMLQLVLKRRDTWSTAADFSSHIFVEAAEPQVALVNAYLGSAKSELEVRDAPTDFGSFKKGSDHERKVHFGTVLDMLPGSYQWRLMDLRSPHAFQTASVEFKAVGRKAYTVLRVGAEAIGGQSFPEELIVWPADGAIVHRGSTDSSSNEKGLFGIPTDLSNSPLHSRAATASPVRVALAIVAFVAIVSR